MTESRKTRDRRGYDREQERAGRCNRRISPDRRLNNIAVEWVPINHVYVHPSTRTVFDRD